MRPRGINVDGLADAGVDLRSALASDGPFLAQMLVEAFAGRPGATKPLVAEAMARAEIARLGPRKTSSGRFRLLVFVRFGKADQATGLQPTQVARHDQEGHRRPYLDEA